MLEVQDYAFFYEPILVEVNSEKKKPVSAFSYDIKNGKGHRLEVPLALEPMGRIQYFEEKEPFNIMSVLKNPFVLMLGMSVVMIFLMKRMPQPDPSEMQGLNEQMKNFNMGSLFGGK